MPRRVHRLSTQIFVANLAILLVTMAAGLALVARSERARLDREVELRAAAIAASVATLPQVRSCLQTPRPGCDDVLQRLTLQVAGATGAAYVVVIDMSGTRHTHPQPELIGQRVSEPISVADGQVHTGVDDGATGRSANGKVPVRRDDGEVVGEVSAGIREDSVTSALWRVLRDYAAWSFAALPLGALASWLLARQLKRRTFGLELDEISRLLQEREATLHGIREGVVAVDERERITVLNDQARQLTGLDDAALGRRLGEVLPPGPLLEALSGGTTPDQVVVTDDLFLVTNRMPVLVGSRRHGSVVTLRDQTEIVELAEQLTGQRNLTDSLRAQQHEYANSMHVVAGLLELDEVDAALAYLLEERGTAAEFDLSLQQHIGNPQLVGLLLGKVAEAHERGIELVIDPNSNLSRDAVPGRALVTIVGNLIDNAFDAVSSREPPRRVELLARGGDQVMVQVRDNGPGVNREQVERIFDLGWTSKPGNDGGTGLALVKRLVTRLGGGVEVSSGEGATFTVRLPRQEVGHG